MLSWMRGEFNDVRVDVPVRWLTGTNDPVMTPDLTNGYADRISDSRSRWSTASATG
jgi:hypothetical protein